MKQARYKEPLPLAVIEAARAGDAGAVEQVGLAVLQRLHKQALYPDAL
ncbi:Uncharacterised protein [uncultured Blautia sp.]|nr:Uncharacterised protein [uncultured Blautia sp.]